MLSSPQNTIVIPVHIYTNLFTFTQTYSLTHSYSHTRAGSHASTGSHPSSRKRYAKEIEAHAAKKPKQGEQHLKTIHTYIHTYIHTSTY
jgi:hypothetical protein